MCVFSWLLYVDSWYRGSCAVLEEGQTVKTSRTDPDPDPDPTAVLSVGSVRTLKVSGAAAFSGLSITIGYSSI